MSNLINEAKRMQQLAGMITENEYQESSKNEAVDYNKVDSILKGTYKRPVAEVDPEGITILPLVVLEVIDPAVPVDEE